MTPDIPKYQAWRRRMVDQLRERGITDETVLAAMEKLPRHWFMSDTLLDTFLYDIDRAIEIDCEQTISKPYTVAWQTQLLSLQPLMTVLEVGTAAATKRRYCARCVPECIPWNGSTHYIGRPKHYWQV